MIPNNSEAFDLLPLVIFNVEIIAFFSTKEESYKDSILSRLTMILATMREKMNVERIPSRIPIENVTTPITVIDITARVRIRLFSNNLIPIQSLYC